MTTQPEALRLADDLVKHLGGNTATQAAAELRRLAEMEDEWMALSQDQGKLEGQIDRLQARLAASEDQAERAVAGCERLRAQRDALLGSLKLIANTNPVDAALDPQRAVRVANVAIKQAEGENT